MGLLGHDAIVNQEATLQVMTDQHRVYWAASTLCWSTYMVRLQLRQILVSRHSEAPENSWTHWRKSSAMNLLIELARGRFYICSFWVSTEVYPLTLRVVRDTLLSQHSMTKNARDRFLLPDIQYYVFISAMLGHFQEVRYRTWHPLNKGLQKTWH
jgi:hypothetical protein